MRDPARIPRILEAIWKVWERHPDLRLTQLLVNAIRPSRPTPQVFAFEDAELEKRLKADPSADMPRTTENEVTLSLTLNEAVVLMAFLVRFRDADTLRVEHPAEEQVLYDLAAVVQQHLTDELTSREWPWLLDQARQAVSARDE
jgi:hypothetical protein